MRPGALFVGALAVFALLGLLAGGTPAPREPPAPGQPTAVPIREEASREPRALARRWGQSFAVWRHRSLPAQLRALATTATPDLATDLNRGAEAVRRDASLSRDGAGSRGSVEIVDLRGGDDRRRVLVVTRELPYVASGTELQGRRYRVYEGTVVRDADGRWRMQSWERQP